MTAILKSCCVKVYRSGGSFLGHPCGKNAKVERDGKHYCGIHDPVRLKAIQDRNDEERRARYAQQRARMEAPAKRITELENELRNILSWAKVEKSPLRQGEIDSIERVLKGQK